MEEIDTTCAKGRIQMDEVHGIGAFRNQEQGGLAS